MRRIQVAGMALLFISCTGGMGSGTRSVTIHLEGAGGQMAYFDKYKNGLPYHVDSIKLDSDGNGVIPVPALPLDFYRIAVGNEQLVVVLDSAESLAIEAQGGLLATPKRLEGSKHTDAMLSFQAESRGYDQKVAALRAALAQDPANQANLDELNATNTAYYERCKQFVKENQASPVAISALGRLNLQQEFDLFKQTRDALRTTMRNSGFFAQFREQVDRFEQEMVMLKAQEEEMKRLSNLLPIGSLAPDIRQSAPDGGAFALSELRGKVVLIDFWASWCRPCRIENPNVKRVYERFKGKGFEILGVSLDRDQQAWVEAIKADGLPWKHVSDLQFWNNAAAQEYGVSSIPYTVLVDREGKVIEKGLRAEQLESRLSELLGG